METENKRKLELTLCEGILNGLKVKLKNFNKVITPTAFGRGMKATENEPYVEHKQSVYTIDICLPLLHSVNKLTEPLLEGGKVPIYELCNMQGFSMPNISECELSFHTDFESQTAMIKMEGWTFRYLGGSEKSFWLNGTEQWSKKHQKSNRQMLMFEKLKEWHFNVYDLPKEMYLEKSEQLTNKQ